MRSEGPTGGIRLQPEARGAEGVGGLQPSLRGHTLAQRAAPWEQGGVTRNALVSDGGRRSPGGVSADSQSPSPRVPLPLSKQGPEQAPATGPRTPWVPSELNSTRGHRGGLGWKTGPRPA